MKILTPTERMLFNKLKAAERANKAAQLRMKEAEGKVKKQQADIAYLSMMVGVNLEEVSNNEPNTTQPEV